jgi:hypothetical protein
MINASKEMEVLMAIALALPSLDVLHYFYVAAAILKAFLVVVSFGFNGSIS